MINFLSKTVCRNQLIRIQSNFIVKNNLNPMVSSSSVTKYPISKVRGREGEQQRRWVGQETNWTPTLIFPFICNPLASLVTQMVAEGNSNIF